MQRLAFIALLFVSPAFAEPPAITPPSAGPVVRLPTTLNGNPGELIEIKAESGAELVSWETSPGLRVLNDRPADPAAKSMILHAREPGVYFVCAMIPHEKAVRSAVCIVTIGPRPPPPDPIPDPTPDPKPEPPAPPAEPVKFLVIIEEGAEATAKRGEYLANVALMDRLKTRGIRWRVADQHVKDGMGQRPRDLVPYLDRAAGKTLPQVFLVGASGKVLHQGDVPASPAALINLLAKFGG